MSLFSPMALWFLSLIPVLILMYILKQKFEEREIPSLYLWHQVLKDTEATSPFQRLRKNLLFLLQLLILLLCIFALTNPFVMMNTKNYENVIMVVDTTGSMSARGDRETLLTEAAIKAEEMLNSLPSGTKVTLISSSKNSKVEVSGATDKKEVLNRLKALEETNSSGNLEDTYSLVKAISNQYRSYKVVYFTDKTLDFKDLNGEIVALFSRKNNISLDYIAQSKVNNTMKAMLRVTNYSSESTTVELCLYGEAKLISLQNVELLKDETKTVYFNNLPDNNRYIYGEITQKDGLEEDNKIYSIIKQKDSKKILLSTDKNVFLEKAISALKDVELYKTLPGEEIKDEFDLYIFDGEVPKDLPKQGNLLFVNPQNSIAFLKLGQEVEGGKITVVSHGITKYMENNDSVVSKIREITIPYWGSSLLKAGDKDISFAGETKGQKIGAIGFDFHNSDLPLTPEFPIFINNLISYLMDRDSVMNTQYFCGDSVDITPLPETEKIFVKDPTDKKVELSSKYPVKPFGQTYKPGIYELIQKIGDKDLTKLVAVNFPTSESKINSNINNNIESISKVNNLNGKGGINLKNILIISALLILIGEWIAYLKS